MAELKYDVITIEREYASGGREIGRMAAAELGLPAYGKEILQLAAERIGASPEYVESMEEKAPNSLIYSLSLMSRMSSIDRDGVTPEAKLQLTEIEVIRELAAKGRCVLIGRRAGTVLKGKQNVLRAFIYADAASRKRRAVESYGDDPGRVELILKRFDRRRENYYSSYMEEKWDGRENYHLMLDSGKLGLERCAELIALAARG